MLGDSPFAPGSGWVGWVIVALVVVVLWSVPIVGTLALFPKRSTRRRHGER